MGSYTGPTHNTRFFYKNHIQKKYEEARKKHIGARHIAYGFIGPQNLLMSIRELIHTLSKLTGPEASGQQ